MTLLVKLGRLDDSTAASDNTQKGGGGGIEMKPLSVAHLGMWKAKWIRGAVMALILALSKKEAIIMPNASSEVVKSRSTVKSRLGEVEWKNDEQQMAVVRAAMMKNSIQYESAQTSGLM